MKLTDVVRDTAEEWFEKLAKAIDLPESKYESADRSYKSICTWLEREESEFSGIDTHVYTQGSFRLGTAIQPFERSEEYDLDIVCEFSLSKNAQTQRDLHAALGRELIEYARRYSMEEPSEWDRCWTMNYAESTRFHMDVLPCVPDASRQRHLRESLGLPLAFVEDAVSITDRTNKNFRVISEDWPSSNPNGFAKWFYDRMRPAFERRRQAIMLAEAKASIDEIPEFRVRTPLQLATQILKRHRDVCYAAGNEELRPSSIIITTLAAHAYEQQSTVLGALTGILQAMPSLMGRHGSQFSIPNPSDPRENFADAWNDNPAKAEAFLAWINTARADFAAARQGSNLKAFIASLAPRLGRDLVESAFEGRRAKTGGSWKLSRILAAKHRKPPEWPVSDLGWVSLEAQVLQNGFRLRALESDAEDLPLGCKLTFRAKTNVPAPFQVFWQVVNTGVSATEAGQLRGTFEDPRTKDGFLTRIEDTGFPGTHSIECFIIKSGFVAASSGIFIVNVGGKRA